MMFRANFGDGTYTSPFPDIRDAKLAIWGRAAIVQYRSFIEIQDDGGNWMILYPSQASKNPIVVAKE